MANWVLLNLGKGKIGDKQIVSEASMAQIHMPQMAMQQPIQYDEVLYPSYGMGWLIAAYRGISYSSTAAVSTASAPWSLDAARQFRRGHPDEYERDRTPQHRPL